MFGRYGVFFRVRAMRKLLCPWGFFVVDYMPPDKRCYRQMLLMRLLSV